MALILRHLRLAVRTSDGDFVADIPFERQLVVLRADNTMGKSTCMQSVLYALGMDAVLQQAHRVPLPPAMTESIEDESGAELSIAESYVELEIENEVGEVATLQRFAKPRAGDHRRIRVWRDARLTGVPTDMSPTDLLARVPGSGVGEAGITGFLSEFLRWSLPEILLPSGSETVLYPELVMPLFFVEQRRGWTSIQGSISNTYGIPEVRKRAIEFTLGLKVYENERRAAALRQLRQQLRTEWRNAISGVSRQLAPLGLALRGISEEVGQEVPFPEVVSVTSNRSLQEERQSLRLELESASSAPDRVRDEDTPPSADADATTEEDRLAEALRELQATQNESTRYEREVAHQKAELDALRAHMLELDRERRRNRDARRLQEFGSDQPWFQSESECPVCHQSLPGTLSVETLHPVMSLDDNLKHIDEQVRAYSAIEAEMSRAIEIAERAQQQQLRQIRDLRSEIRALRSTLVTPSEQPSIAAIERRVRLENRLAEFEQVDLYVGGLVNQLTEILEEARATDDELSSLPTSGLPPEDEERIRALERSFLEQLHEYGFSSFPVDVLGISRYSYRPEREGFDLGFDLSASDGIRVIWAYLVGLLEVAREHSTNHPGFLILDEPRQQSASEYSLGALLQRAARAGRAGQQVIFASSEPLESLEPMLHDIEHQLIRVTGRILKRAGPDAYNPEHA